MVKEELASIVAIALILAWVRIETGMWLIEIFNEHLLP